MRNNKRLYESIMKDVSKIVKKHLNETDNEMYDNQMLNKDSKLIDDKDNHDKLTRKEFLNLLEYYDLKSTKNIKTLNRRSDEYNRNSKNITTIYHKNSKLIDSYYYPSIQIKLLGYGWEDTQSYYADTPHSILHIDLNNKHEESTNYRNLDTNLYANDYTINNLQIIKEALEKYI